MVHSIHGWEDDEVSFLTHPTVRHLDFLGRSYDQNIENCTEAQKTHGTEDHLVNALASCPSTFQRDFFSSHLS